ncbi:MAG: peptide ABC transporter substrate-binding protein [Steroidobacteraceae bacterium]
MDGRLVRGIVVLLALGALGGCAERGAPAARTAADNVLLHGLDLEPDSLDPQKARSVEAQRVLRDICEGLTTLDRHGRPAPGIATGWTVSADGKTYTFALRHDARWSTGAPVVAADFVAGLRRLVDPHTASDYAEVVSVIRHAPGIIAGRRAVTALGVAAPTPYTVTIQLRAPAHYLPALLAHPATCPVDPALLQRYGASYAQPGHMPSDGAFVLTQWVHGSYIELTRNPDYWRNAATRLSGVRYVIATDENAELEMYRAGELDIMDVVPRTEMGWIRSHLGAQLHIEPELGTYYYGFNLRRAPFKGARGLRRALTMVIDRDKLTRFVLRAGERPAYSWVPPGTDGYQAQVPAWSRLGMAARISEARRLYAAAGYSAAHPLSFTLEYNTGEIHEDIALAVASMWREALGVRVRLRREDFSSLMHDVESGKATMFRSSWIGDYNDPYTFAQYFKSDFGINLPHYDDPAYDRLVDQAEATLDPARRAGLLEQAERLMLHDQPIIPLYFYVSKHLVRPRVTGWYDNVMDVTYSRELGLRTAAP